MSEEFLGKLSVAEQKRLFPLWIEESEYRIARAIRQDKELWEEIAFQRGSIKDYEARLKAIDES